MYDAFWSLFGLIIGLRFGGFFYALVIYLYTGDLTRHLTDDYYFNKEGAFYVKGVMSCLFYFMTLIYTCWRFSLSKKDYLHKIFFVETLWFHARVCYRHLSIPTWLRITCKLRFLGCFALFVNKNVGSASSMKHLMRNFECLSRRLTRFGRSVCIFETALDSIHYSNGQLINSKIYVLTNLHNKFIKSKINFIFTCRAKYPKKC